MSEIDSYRHKCIGIVRCPSSYWPPTFHQLVPLYLLEQDAYDSGFPAKKGDLLLGGGSGESPAFRISMPEALIFFTREDWEKLIPVDDFQTLGDLHKSIYRAHWSMNDAVVFGDGYAKLGWDPSHISIEIWLVGHILAFVLRNYESLWSAEPGATELVADGSICRLPTPDEVASL